MLEYFRVLVESSQPWKQNKWQNSSLGWYVWETYLEMGWEPMFPWNVSGSPDFPASLEYLFGCSWHDHHDPTEVWGYVSWLGSGLYPIEVLFFCRLNVRVFKSYSPTIYWAIFQGQPRASSHGFLPSSRKLSHKNQVHPVSPNPNL